MFSDVIILKNNKEFDEKDNREWFYRSNNDKVIVKNLNSEKISDFDENFLIRNKDFFKQNKKGLN